MSDTKPSMAEIARRIQAQVEAEGGPKLPDAPKPKSNLYSDDEIKLVSDETVARAKQAGSLTAAASRLVLEKGKEAAELAAAKTKAALAEHEARKAEEARLQELRRIAEKARLAEQARLQEIEAAQEADRARRAADIAQAEAARVEPLNQETQQQAPSAIAVPLPPAITLDPELTDDLSQVVVASPDIPALKQEVAPARNEVESTMLAGVELAEKAQMPREAIQPKLHPAPQEAIAAPAKHFQRQKSKVPLIVGGAFLVGALVGGAWWMGSQSKAPSATPAIAPSVVSVPLPVPAPQASTPVVGLDPTQSSPVINDVPEPAPLDEPLPEQIPPVEVEPAIASQPEINQAPEPVEKVVEVPVRQKIIEPTPKPKPKPKPAAVAPEPKPAPSSLDKGIEDLEALEKALGG